jgi:hypothetical protein
MAKVTRLPRPETLTLPIGGGGSVRLTAFRETPKVLLELRGPQGGDLGALLLPTTVARLVAEGLARVADGDDSGDATPPAPAGNATSLLTTSLDADATLACFARLAVPVFADWCTIDVVDGPRSPRRLTVVHADATKARAARTLARHPHDPRQAHPRSAVWGAAQPDVAPDVPDERLVAAARSAAHLDVLRALACRSSLAVPIMAGGRVAGVLTFALAESRRRYTDADLPTAMMLARCASLAAENARLYAEAHAALRARVGTSPVRRTSAKRARARPIRGRK